MTEAQELERIRRAIELSAFDGISLDPDMNAAIAARKEMLAIERSKRRWAEKQATDQRWEEIKHPSDVKHIGG